MDKSNQIDTFSRITRVSRETIISLKKYENKLIKANETLNLIGKSTIKDIQGILALSDVDKNIQIDFPLIKY